MTLLVSECVCRRLARQHAARGGCGDGGRGRRAGGFGDCAAPLAPGEVRPSYSQLNCSLYLFGCVSTSSSALFLSLSLLASPSFLLSLCVPPQLCLRITTSVSYVLMFTLSRFILPPSSSQIVSPSFRRSSQTSCSTKTGMLPFYHFTR